LFSKCCFWLESKSILWKMGKWLLAF
jgi:hypothetical protein